MIKINKKDLEWASKNKLIAPEQIDSLWSALESNSKEKSEFNLTKIIYYFGALLIILGVGWFTNEAWDKAGGSALFGLGLVYFISLSYLAYYLFYKKELKASGGIVATIAIFMVPVALFGFQKMTGLWPHGDSSSFKNYHIRINGSWIFLEIGTILAGIIMLRFIKHTFISAPVFLSLWYMSMDLGALLYGKNNLSWDERKLFSMFFGLIILSISYLWDRRTELDYAFWGYLFGTLAFWGGLSSMNSDSELNKFLYFSVNILLIFLSILFERKIFIICGVLGCIAYLNHLAYSVFKDFLSFPIIVSAIGLLIIFVGIKYQKNKDKFDSKIKSLIPKSILDLSPTKR